MVGGGGMPGGRFRFVRRGVILGVPGWAIGGAPGDVPGLVKTEGVAAGVVAGAVVAPTSTVMVGVAGVAAEGFPVPGLEILTWTAVAWPRSSASRMALVMPAGSWEAILGGSCGMKFGARVEGGALGAPDVVTGLGCAPPTITVGSLGLDGLDATFCTGFAGRGGVGRGLRLGMFPRGLALGLVPPV